MRLRGKIESYTQMGSGWAVTRILKISLVVTKISEIISMSGSSYIPSPKSLSQSHAIINVHNTDNKCFLYAILSVMHYDDIQINRDRQSKYDVGELIWEKEWFPMKLETITKFEQSNPYLAINVLVYHNNSILEGDEDIFKNPNVDIVRRSTNGNGRTIYLLLLQKGILFYAYYSD